MVEAVKMPPTNSRDLLERPYQPSDQVCGPRLDWIRHMLRDMGVTGSGVDKRVQEAVDKYIIDYVERAEKLGGLEITMGDLESFAHAFWDGYEQGLVDSGALECRSVE